MDLAVLSTGIGYKQKTEKSPETYTSLNSVNIIGVDTAVDMSQLMANWNI